MAPPLLSTSEADYVLAGLLESTPQRHDLRPLEAFRQIHLQTGVAPTANASARINLGGTEVTAAVSCQIDPLNLQGQGAGPSSGKSKGGVECSVQYSNALVHSPLPSTIPSLDALSSSLTSLLTALCSTIPLADLEIIPPPQARFWVLHVDAHISSLSGGNVEDALIMAAHAALYGTRIPRTRPISYQQTAANDSSAKGKGTTNFLDTKVSGTAAMDTDAGGGADIDLAARLGIKGALSFRTGGKVVDFELLDSGEGGDFLSNRLSLPVSISVYLLPNGKCLLDPTLAETGASGGTRVHVLADREGKVYGVYHVAGASTEEAADGDHRSVPAAGAPVSVTGIGTEYATARAAMRTGATHAKQLAAHLQTLLASAAS